MSHTLAQLRNEYWIPQGRAEVKKAIHGCGTCKRFQGGPFKLPSMSPWPRKKFAKCAPFTYTGLEYFGPLYIQGVHSKITGTIQRAPINCKHLTPQVEQKQSEKSTWHSTS